jgi:hypothetical protein
MLAAGSLLAALSLNPGIASAGNWSPNSAVVVGASTNFIVEAEKEAGVIARSACPNVTLNGTLGVNSPTWTITPGLNCGGYGTNGTWTAMDENMTQAAMKIPVGTKAEIQIQANCKLVFENLTITKANNFLPGANGAARPARWILKDKVSYSSQNPAKCFKNVEAGMATFRARFLMINTTNTAVAIKVN